MDLEIGCRLRFDVREPTTFVLAIQVADGAGQALRDERIDLPDGVEAEFFVDAFAANRFIRFLAQTGFLDFGYQARVRKETVVDHRRFIADASVRDLPLNVLPYLAPSRYCQSDRLEAFARQTFGRQPGGLGTAQAIADWIGDHIAYEAGSSYGHTSALDTLIDRKGVCRDFAHLGVALARALDMPTRFVACYALDLEPADFHAVFEVFLDGAWRTFDATRKVSITGLVPIAFGRDAADVPFVSTFGDARFVEMTVEVRRA
ncbi:transglutaminase family protein [Caulobacter sp. 1776]|uniref:transglutaminase-like domain-containing protein n=1 Tax=Caulobacter sp. 1776 TaxID=3156420 RepID=UPI0033931621